jgi:hypothetical protein
MDTAVKTILKQNEVHLTRARAAEGHRPESACSAVPQPHAQIVRQSPQEAIVEVTCVCGCKVHLRCTVAAAPPAGAAGGISR